MKYRQAVIAVVLAVAAAGCGPGTVTPPPASVSPTAISSPATTESATSPAVTPSGSSPSTGTQTLPLPDFLNGASHLDQLLAVWEFRLQATPWLVMTPKAP